jgi:hypothetical protein
VPERNYTPPDAPLEQFLELLDVLGLERAVIVQPSVYGTDNTCTEDAIRRMDGRARGVAVIDPAAPEAEIARLDAAGFRGARLNLIHTGGSTPLEAIETVAAKVAPFRWHVQLYLRGRILPDILPRLRGLPTEIVIDHLGHMEPEEGIEQSGFKALLALMDAGRCWVKLCAYRFDQSGAPFNTRRSVLSGAPTGRIRTYRVRGPGFPGSCRTMAISWTRLAHGSRRRPPSGGSSRTTQRIFTASTQPKAFSEFPEPAHTPSRPPTAYNPVGWPGGGVGWNRFDVSRNCAR